ncbi:MAG: sarcosine oxidase subunit gamma [Aestuariivirga sp.]
MPELYFESPLVNVESPQGLATGLREISDRGMIDLRGLTTDRKFLAAAKDVLGCDLPKKPRTSISWGDSKILWLSTDQWLILCPRARVSELAGALRQALGNIHSLAVDVSDMRCVIRLEGEGAAEILMKGCSLDLLGGDYVTGTVRRMRFAEIAALLHVVDNDVFDIYVLRSYAAYAWEFLLAAAREPAKIRLFGKQAAPV